MFFEDKLNFGHFGQCYLVRVDFLEDVVDFAEDVVAPPQGAIIRFIEKVFGGVNKLDKVMLSKSRDNLIGILFRDMNIEEFHLGRSKHGHLKI